MNLEAKLEEYRQLQEAMRQLRVRQDRGLYFMFLIFIGVIGIGFRWPYSILYMTSSFILLYLWLDEIRVFNSIIRLGTYIEIFIEREIDELKHFTMSGKHRLHTKKGLKLLRALANGIIPILSLLFFLLARHFKNNLIPNISHSISIIFYWIYLYSFFIGLSSLAFWSIWATLKGRKRENNEWKRIKNLIDAEK